MKTVLITPRYNYSYLVIVSVSVVLVSVSMVAFSVSLMVVFMVVFMVVLMVVFMVAFSVTFSVAATSDSAKATPKERAIRREKSTIPLVILLIVNTPFTLIGRYKHGPAFKLFSILNLYILECKGRWSIINVFSLNRKR